jgi:hypothetical protein
VVEPITQARYTVYEYLNEKLNLYVTEVKAGWLSALLGGTRNDKFLPIEILDAYCNEM